MTYLYRQWVTSVDGRSATRHLLQVLGVPSPLDRDLRGGAIDLTEIVGREFDRSRSDVLVQALKLPGARDWNNPRLLGEQPGKRDLSRCRLLPLPDPAEQINQDLIR